MENKKVGIEKKEFTRSSKSSPIWDIASLKAENEYLKVENECLCKENEEFDRRISRVEKLNDALLEQAEKRASTRASGLFCVGVLTGVSFTLGLLYVLEIISKLF